MEEIIIIVEIRIMIKTDLGASLGLKDDIDIVIFRRAQGIGYIYIMYLEK